MKASSNGMISWCRWIIHTAPVGVAAEWGCIGIDPERAYRGHLIDIARPGDRLVKTAWDVLIITGPRKVGETEAAANYLSLEDLDSVLREEALSEDL